MITVQAHDLLGRQATHQIRRGVRRRIPTARATQPRRTAASSRRSGGRRGRLAGVSGGRRGRGSPCPCGGAGRAGSSRATCCTSSEVARGARQGLPRVEAPGRRAGAARGRAPGFLGLARAAEHQAIQVSAPSAEDGNAWRAGRVAGLRGGGGQAGRRSPGPTTAVTKGRRPLEGRDGLERVGVDDAVAGSGLEQRAGRSTRQGHRRDAAPAAARTARRCRRSSRPRLVRRRRGRAGRRAGRSCTRRAAAGLSGPSRRSGASISSARVAPLGGADGGHGPARMTSACGRRSFCGRWTTSGGTVPSRLCGSSRRAILRARQRPDRRGRQPGGAGRAARRRVRPHLHRPALQHRPPAARARTLTASRDEDGDRDGFGGRRYRTERRRDRAYADASTTTSRS